MHFVVAICNQCTKIRYRSIRPFNVGESLNPSDFVPEPGQDPPSQNPGDPALCSECGDQLAFKRIQDPGKPSGTLPQRNGTTKTSEVEHSSMSNGSGNLSPVQCLFEAGPNEAIVKMSELPGQRWCVVTSRRILVIDPTLLEVSV